VIGFKFRLLLLKKPRFFALKIREVYSLKKFLNFTTIYTYQFLYNCLGLTMVREFESSINEKEFILQGIKEGLRLDNRDKYDFRPISISFGPDYGRSEVTLGNTR
jgi:hypothetical protein